MTTDAPPPSAAAVADTAWSSASGMPPPTRDDDIRNFPLNESDDGGCVDIKRFLWQKQNDLTALPATMAAFGVVYSLIVVLGITGNLLVICSVARHRSLQSVRNLFIVSLSCSDIVVSIVSGTITPITAFAKVWLFGAALCKLVPVIQGASLCFSTLTLTAISIDRFLLIIYPTRRFVQKRHALRMIGANCAVAAAVSAPMFPKQALIRFDRFCGRFCAEDWGDDDAAAWSRSVYGTLVFVLQFVVPFLVITFCYLMISLKLGKGMMLTTPQRTLSTCAAPPPPSPSPATKESGNGSFAIADALTEKKRPSNGSVIAENASSSTPSRTQKVITTRMRKSTLKKPLRGSTTVVNAAEEMADQRRQQALRRRLRTNRMLMAMVGVFLCCWTPSVVFNFLRDYQWLPGMVVGHEYLCGIVTHCISMSSTVWNPILYALLNEHFRAAFAQLLRRRHRHHHWHRHYRCAKSIGEGETVASLRKLTAAYSFGSSAAGGGTASTAEARAAAFRERIQRCARLLTQVVCLGGGVDVPDGGSRGGWPSSRFFSRYLRNQPAAITVIAAAATDAAAANAAATATDSSITAATGANAESEKEASLLNGIRKPTRRNHRCDWRAEESSTAIDDGGGGGGGEAAETSQTAFLPSSSTTSATSSSSPSTPDDSLDEPLVIPNAGTTTGGTSSDSSALTPLLLDWISATTAVVATSDGNTDGTVLMVNGKSAGSGGNGVVGSLTFEELAFRDGDEQI